MTEPKEEKCEACCGSGYINFWTDDGHISMRTCRRCDGYGYIKVKQMTNEEWRKTCSTEDFAEWLSNLAYACMRCGMTNSKAYCHTNFCIQDKEDAMEWLKQPHNSSK